MKLKFFILDSQPAVKDMVDHPIFAEERTMKEGIHPEYKETTIRCACGSQYKTRSTKGDMQVEVCSNCHPFYTGNQKIVDAAGRVDRFKKKYKMK